jgi:hypothetical protein
MKTSSQNEAVGVVKYAVTKKIKAAKSQREASFTFPQSMLPLVDYGL